jgi:hypothetical protein
MATKTRRLRTEQNRASRHFTEPENNKTQTSYVTVFGDSRDEQLKGIDPEVVQKAWFTLAHLLIDPGSIVADMGTTDGAMAYTMAVLRPDLYFIGIDSDSELISQARQSYTRDNLKFIEGDIRALDWTPGSLDAIINSFILHEIYTQSRYNEQSVNKLLSEHLNLLKTDGYMLIRNYAMPVPDQYVMLELPDTPSSSQSPQALSDADLLVSFSEHAREDGQFNVFGFFLEELPPRFPGTRLFHLPYKWAYEFMVRKHDRDHWNRELAKEYCFFTERDMRKNLLNMGARVLYSAPHWETDFLNRHFEGQFRLYDDDARPMGAPATSHIFLAQKCGQQRSLSLKERRKMRYNTGRLQIEAVRDELTGTLTDIIHRATTTAEFMPYRVGSDNQLYILVHFGIPRGLVNAVPRSGANLDGKRWSGHMIESVHIDADDLHRARKHGRDGAHMLATEYLGLKPAVGSVLEDGPSFYPDPHHIDERVETAYLRLAAGGHYEAVWPRLVPGDLEAFSSTGRVREMNARHILDAIAVGLIPAARLELQILTLYERLGLKSGHGAQSPMKLKHSSNLPKSDMGELMRALTIEDHRFRPNKGTAGQFRVAQSVFVDEGQDENGGAKGLAADEKEFVVPNANTVNRAVVLPLTKDISGEVMAGIVSEYMPIPQRYKGTGFTVTAPSFEIPRDVRSIEDARKFIADQFEVDIANVTRMGESYFTHIGVTQQKIYPFAVASTPEDSGGQTHGPTQYAPLKHLWKLLYYDCDESFLSLVAKSYQQFCQDHELSVEHDFARKFSLERGSALPGRYITINSAKPDN